MEEGWILSRNAAIGEIVEIVRARPYWSHGQEMLDRLGFDPTDNLGRSAFSDRLNTAAPELFDRAQRYFEVGPFKRRKLPWSEAGFRLFISHASSDKHWLPPYIERLAGYGVQSFVAHEDIEPTENWRNELLKALDIADGVVSLHSKAFAESQWCGQEVGYALARKIPVVPILLDVAPGGFLGALQGFRWNDDLANVVQKTIAAIAKHPAASSALGAALSRQMKFAGSFNRGGELVDLLEQCDELFQPALDDLIVAGNVNDQVSGAVKRFFEERPNLQSRQSDAVIT